MSSQENSPQQESTHNQSMQSPSILFLVLVSILTAAADLLSKAWAVHRLSMKGKGPAPIIELIKDRFYFKLAWNPAGAWSLFRNQPEHIRKPFFIVVSLIAIFAIVGMYRKLDSRQTALKWGLPLVLGGAIGNLVDRIRYGQVADFIDVIYWRSQGLERHWPTFNVADITICVGVGLMAIDFFFPVKRVAKLSKASTSIS